jgi:hypothetical protein
LNEQNATVFSWKVCEPISGTHIEWRPNYEVFVENQFHTIDNPNHSPNIETLNEELHRFNCRELTKLRDKAIKLEIKYFGIYHEHYGVGYYRDRNGKGYLA